jgi:outer membrane murein-binding lipoprotein Lpp
MKTFAMTTAAAVLAAAPLLAGSLAEADTDGSGTFTLEELQAAFPNLTEDTFAAIDANADGEVDLAEAQAAADAGVLPAAG